MGLVRILPLPVRLPLIRAALAAAQAAREPGWRRLEQSRTQGPLVVSGFLGEALGVGRAADATADALEQAGFTVQRASLRGAQKRVWKAGDKPPVSCRPGGVWLIHANAPEVEVALMTHDPADWAGRYRIGYWAWETTEAPPDWARVAPWLDEIWTTSRFTSDAVRAMLERAGMAEQTAKIRVMPHPVQPPVKVKADPARFRLEPNVRHALMMFDGRSAFARKNPWAAIEAWTTAIPVARPDSRLVIKGNALDTDPGARRRLTKLLETRNDIRLVEADLSSDDLWSLIASVDLLISLHRAEGFGLVPAEAMALGKPVVMTGWSGVLDFADDSSAALVPGRLTPVKDPSGAYRTGEWAEPDIIAAAAHIRELIDDPPRAARLGAAGPARIAALSKAWTAEALNALPFASLIDKSDRSPVP